MRVSLSDSKTLQAIATSRYGALDAGNYSRAPVLTGAGWVALFLYGIGADFTRLSARRGWGRS